jgi:hypothetical protein
MNDVGPPPDPGDLELLRIPASIAPTAKARVRVRLAAVVPSLGGGAAGGMSGQAPRFARAASTAPYGMALAAFLAGGVVGAVLYARLAPAPASRVVFVDRPVSSAVGAGAPPVQAAPPPIASAPTAFDVAAPIAASPRSTPSQLSAERRILDEARGALLRGEAQQALDALDRHRRTFPSALLGEERDALQVQALVKAGRYADARTRGEAFRRRLPDSFYLPMVDSALASIP